MDKIMKFFVKAVLGILLFVVYIFIINIASNLYGNGIHVMFYDGNADIFCICISGIITPVLNLLYMKILRFNYEKLTDYLPSAVLFFIMCLTMGVSNSTGNLSIYLLVLYVAGNCIYFFIHYLICTGKEHKHIYSDMVKRLLSVAILFAVYSLIMNDIDIMGDMTGFFVRSGIAIIITLIFYFISTKYLKISYDNKGLDRSILIFLVINFIFSLIVSEPNDHSFFASSSVEEAFYRTCVSTFMYAYICLAAFVIIFICRFIKRKVQGDRVYRQPAKDLSLVRADEKDNTDNTDEKDNTDNTDENELTDRSEPQKSYNLQAVVLEDIKKFLMDSEKDFLLIDEGYHLNAGNDVYHPDLLFYHMKLQCNVAVYLRFDDFKPEYSDGMNVYLETLEQDVKKPNENPSVGILFCKNEGTEVVEYSLNKGLSQEMSAEYEAKLPDKKILREKLGELYNRAKGNHSGSDK